MVRCKILAAIGLALIAAAGCDLCGNQVVNEVRSPSGSYRAIVFERDCGATTDFSTQVSILPSGKKLPNDSGNIFSANSDHGRIALDSHGTMNLKIEWKGDHELHIGYPGAARVFEKVLQYRDVSILYAAN